MKSAFQKISRVRGWAGGTKWYLSDDCLLSAKRMMYTVEYRRFYLRDLESITVWPSRTWKLRVIIPTAILLAIGGLVWAISDNTAVEITIAAIFGVLGLCWLARELGMGPTAHARIRTTGATVELPLVRRTRRARKVLARIDDAVRTVRAAQQPTTTVDCSAPGPERSSSERERNVCFRFDRGRNDSDERLLISPPWPNRNPPRRTYVTLVACFTRCEKPRHCALIAAERSAANV